MSEFIQEKTFGIFFLLACSSRIVVFEMSKFFKEQCAIVEISKVSLVYGCLVWAGKILNRKCLQNIQSMDLIKYAFQRWLSSGQWHIGKKQTSFNKQRLRKDTCNSHSKEYKDLNKAGVYAKTSFPQRIICKSFCQLPLSQVLFLLSNHSLPNWSGIYQFLQKGIYVSSNILTSSMVLFHFLCKHIYFKRQ